MLEKKQLITCGWKYSNNLQTTVENRIKKCSGRYFLISLYIRNNAPSLENDIIFN